MTKDDIHSILAAGESDSIEFKESWSNSAVESIAAFANANGGDLFIGIRDDGTVRGVTLGKETLRDWSNRISQATGIHPHIESITYKGKYIVHISVLKTQGNLVSIRGRYWIRVGSCTRQMTEDDITHAILGKIGITWDEVVEPRAKFDDFDLDQFHRFRVLCNQKGRRIIPPEEDDVTVLEKLGLMKDGHLLRAAILLFGITPQRFYPSSLVKVGRFRSDTHIVDDREMEGSIFDQVDQVMAYFRERLETRYEFLDQPVREVIWEYPLEALREAITNAVCHRDYLIDAHTQVRWYDDRLIFLNPGTLLPPLRIEELKREHLSHLRNRKVAEMLFYAGWIERWGSGTLKIYREFSRAGMPEPLFEEREGSFSLKMFKFIHTYVNFKLPAISKRQSAALEYMKSHDRITTSDYQNLTNVSRATAKRDLTDLVNRDLFEMYKQGRTTHYKLAQKAQ